MSTAHNPRGRDLRRVTAAATEPTRLSTLGRPRTGDQALDSWITKVTDLLEIREGSRGNPFEKTLTARDLVDMGVITAGQVSSQRPVIGRTPTSGGGVVVSDPNGGTVVVSYEAFADSIRQTKLYQDLLKSTNDPTRFEEMHSRTQQALLKALAPIDGKIDATIKHFEEKFSDASESFAQTVSEVQARVATASAGVRQVSAASASATRAVATNVTQVSARLNSFDGSGSTVEQVMEAVADGVTGLEAKYTVKVTAGGAVAGFGLAATSNTAGPSSAFIIQADKFAIVTSSYSGGLDTTPDVANVPFGVDGSGVYVNAPLNVNGTTGINLISGSAVGKFKLDASSNLVIQGTASNKSIKLTAPNAGGISIDDFTTASQTTLLLMSPNDAGSGAGVFQTKSGVTLDVVGGSVLRLTSGIIGTGAMTIKAGSFSFTGAAKLVTSGVDVSIGNNTASGSATATFDNTTKPGSNTTNQWMPMVWNGTTVYVPIWQ